MVRDRVTPFTQGHTGLHAYDVTCQTPAGAFENRCPGPRVHVGAQGGTCRLDFSVRGRVPNNRLLSWHGRLLTTLYSSGTRCPDQLPAGADEPVVTKNPLRAAAWRGFSYLLEILGWSSTTPATPILAGYSFRRRYTGTNGGPIAA